MRFTLIIYLSVSLLVQSGAFAQNDIDPDVEAERAQARQKFHNYWNNEVRDRAHIEASLQDVDLIARVRPEEVRADGTNAFIHIGKFAHIHLDPKQDIFWYCVKYGYYGLAPSYVASLLPCGRAVYRHAIVFSITLNDCDFVYAWQDESQLQANRDAWWRG